MEQPAKRKRGRPRKTQLQTISSLNSAPAVVGDSRYVNHIRNSNLQTTETLMETVKQIVANELDELLAASSKRTLTATEGRNLNKVGYLLTVINREERENLKYGKSIEDKELLSMIASTFGVDQNKLEQFLNRDTNIVTPIDVPSEEAINEQFTDSD